MKPIVTMYSMTDETDRNYVQYDRLTNYAEGALPGSPHTYLQYLYSPSWCTGINLFISSATGIPFIITLSPITIFTFSLKLYVPLRTPSTTLPPKWFNGSPFNQESLCNLSLPIILLLVPPRSSYPPFTVHHPHPRTPHLALIHLLYLLFLLSLQSIILPR